MAETNKGGIKVETQHIFPIIKKWLYSEKDIFLREIVSNACDAITKLQRLISLGEVKGLDGKGRIDVILNRDDKTLTVSDNGIGMSREEVEKYICQIALSGALDFIEKYESAGENTGSGIIGHFGLGFYSAFMVSDNVDVQTKSYTDAPAVNWTCSEAGDYEISEGDRAERGTTVVMHITDEEAAYLSDAKIREILEKYCFFMPHEIYYTLIDSENESKEEKKECTCGHDHDHADGECTCGHDHDGEECDCKKEKPINDTSPLWQKNASDCEESEYTDFYRKVFNDYREPLFHIHINADYPLNFKGILYFPRLNHEFDNLEGQVKLYYNQVFVADNIKEVIPEFMLMLKGVLDCPELPLNVSRSYLQNSAYVSKMSAHIVKKVADKLNSMFNTEREKYEQIWNDIKVFVEYGCMKDRKFYDRVKNSLLLQLTDGSFKTVDDYLEKAKEKHENKIYYTVDKNAQAQYVSLYTAQGIEVVCLDKMIETQFISFIEQDKGIKYIRVDADIDDSIKGDGETTENKELSDLFVKVSGDEKLKVRYDALKDTEIAAILNVSEESRRFEDMMRMYAMSGGGETMKMPLDQTLIVNTSNEAVKKLCARPVDEQAERAARQIYTLALLGQRQLTPEEMKTFMNDTLSGIASEL
ncbi:MAG: molecular chaperone HtpG [Ruminococcaceae bacterium]|nr:molecular chaperone HtpG [Oscillospiraceae bacterium]